MEESNFNYRDWQAGERSDYPLNARCLRHPYKFRALKCGIRKDGRPGQSFETTRKQTATRNAAIAGQVQAFFFEKVLPLIEADLNPMAWRNIATSTARPELNARGGFTLYKMEDGTNRATWIHHSETDLITRALSMGAKPQA